MSLAGLELKKLKRIHPCSNTDISKSINDNKSNNMDIAIIGMSCLFPDAKNPEEFWKNILSGKSSIGEFPKKRIDNLEEYLKLTNKSNARFIKGAYLEEIDKFDNDFFKITPREARMMNPNQRLFLKNVWTTIEDSGYGGNKLSGTNTGIYLGLIGSQNANKYMQILSEIYDSEELNIAMAGNLTSIIPSRISYFLNLTGPSMVIDTACSSSLVAVHMACTAIRNGECEQAIAGGIRISLLPIEDGFKVGMEASDGITRTFDDNSDGTGMGEGVGTVFLKPLHQAEKDGDFIHAVIKGSAINQDGTTVGITAPNPSAQTKVVKKAWENAHINPESISYIEAHGTGTKLGDPIEVNALTRAFGEFTTQKQFCAIGSVKTNIGHLYEAAGIASLIKAVLCLKKKKLPPLINFNIPNEKINFLDSALYINDEIEDWETDFSPRRCGVSSFGFSGTNCHVILEEYAPETIAESINDKKNRIFTLSSNKKHLLYGYIQSYIDYLTEFGELNIADICYTADTGRGHYKYRLAFTVQSVEELVDKLKSIMQLGLDTENDICYGVADEKKMSDNQANEILKKNYITDADLEKLCELYVSGADIIWKDLYSKENRKKVSLPTYYFDKKSCWFTIDDIEKYSNIKSRQKDVSGVLQKVNMRIADSHKEKVKNFEFIEAVYSEINLYTGVLLLKSFQKMGIFRVAGEKYTISEIKSRLGLINKYEGLFGALLEILKKYGFICLEDDYVLTLDVYNQGIPEIKVSQEFMPVFRMLNNTISALKDILAGNIPATDVIFPKGSMALVEAVYSGNRISDYFNDLIALYVCMYVRELAKVSGNKRKIKILEIGSGTGSTSCRVMDKLFDLKDSVSFCYTDISAGFVNYGKRNLGDKYPFATFKVLDIEKDISTQGFEPFKYDVIFASNVIHATSSIYATFGHIKKLLGYSGIFILNELTKSQDFLTLTFGLLDGWWLSKDTEIRLRNAPLIGVESWKNIYSNNGFGQIETFGLSVRNCPDSYQSIICGMKSEKK
jgi:polyketide synthase PksN